MTRTVLLGDVAEVLGGGTPSTTNTDYWGGDIPWITPRDLSSYNDVYISKGERYISEVGLANSSAKLFPAETVIFSSRAPIGYVTIASRSMTTNQGCKGIICNDRELDNKYLFYWLKLSKEKIEGLAGGSTFKEISTNGVRNLEIMLPDIETQNKIAYILGTIDEKIELNRKMNETLEQMGQVLFSHHFIDNPDAEKWSKRELGEFFPIKTGKKDANFGTEDGRYPFFTCAQTISKAPDFSFDAHALLMAGNGDFNLKLYRGKFEAYQRTYVLIPEDERLLGVLYFLMNMKLHEITGGSRGSVIKFITKGMIENYKFALPKNKELVEMAEVFNQLTVNIEENVKQIQTLTTLRDTLLPRLINGKVKA